MAKYDEDTSQYNKNNSFKIKWENNKTSYIMLDPLFLSKQKTSLYPFAGVYHKMSKDNFKLLNVFWQGKQNRKKSFEYVQNKINKYEKNVFLSEIKYLKEKKN